MAKIRDKNIKLILLIKIQHTIQQMMKNNTMIDRFWVAFTSRFWAEFSKRSIWVSLWVLGVRVPVRVLLLLLVDTTRIDDDVVLLT